jgi:hypothetical protein
MMMNKTAKKSWCPGLMTWLIVAGLVLVNASVFLSSDDPQATQKLLHHFNPYHFPDWYSTILWLVFAGLVIALLFKSNRVQSAFHNFYSSQFWQSVKTRFKNSKPNQAVVRFLLHRKTGKWLLRKWLIFWKNIRVERYPVYALWFTALAIFIVVFRNAVFMETPRQYFWYYWRYPRQFIYYSVYTPYYLAPLIEYNISGTNLARRSRNQNS